MVPLRKSVVQARRVVGKPAARELVPTMPDTSARWHTHDYPGPYCRWHYHPEFEIHLIQHGTGRSIVGDHIGRFTAGNLVLVGSNLPHDWISDVSDGGHITNRDVVFQFHPQWIRDCQQLLPELRAVDPLLARAASGIEFTGPTAAAAASQLLAIGDSAGIDRLHHILALLDILCAAPPEEAQLLASPWIPPLDKGGTDDLIDDALNYIFTNSRGEIRLADVAARAAMSESGFSRYFRRSAGQSFSDTVRKLRLAHAASSWKTPTNPSRQSAIEPAIRTSRTSTASSAGNTASPPASTAAYTKPRTPARRIEPSPTRTLKPLNEDFVTAGCLQLSLARRTDVEFT
jgi:AraC-like DNA-binding protein